MALLFAAIGFAFRPLHQHAGVLMTLYRLDPRVRAGGWLRCVYLSKHLVLGCDNLSPDLGAQMREPVQGFCVIVRYFTVVSSIWWLRCGKLYQDLVAQMRYFSPRS